MPQLLTILNKASKFLSEKGSPSPTLDAEVLLANVLGMQRIDLYVNYDRPLDKRELAGYREAIARRAKLEPVAYITGKKEFYSREFKVNNNVLIPRPETELLVEKVLGYIENFEIESPMILDLCTGSGALAITLDLELEDATITATDIAKESLVVARENAKTHNASVEFIEGDLFTGVNQKFDIIVSNPPYIPTESWEKLEPNVKLYEPKIALDGGEDGLLFYRRIINESPSYLKDAGALFLEIGQNQDIDVAKLAEMSKVFAPAMVAKDLAGINRVIFLKRLISD